MVLAAILHIDPNAPAIVHAGAAALLVLHIGGAFTGLTSGAVAMIAPKGGRLHRLAGNVFFAAMLTMGGVGAAVAPFMTAGQTTNLMAGSFTCYLVATAWATVRRRPGQTGRFEIGAMIVAAAAAMGAAAIGVISATSAHPMPQPQGTVIFVFAVIAALAAAADLRAIQLGGLLGPARIRRHLWRMSTALLIASASFAGQPKAIPRFLHGSPLTVLPAILVLGAMIYWLIRTRAPKTLAPKPAPPARMPAGAA